MAGFRALSGGRRSSGTASASFPVLRGKGILAGDAGGAVARALLQGGAIRINEPNGIGADPVIYSLPGPVEIARVQVDLTQDATEIVFEGELLDVEITQVVLRDFSAVPAAGVQFGLYSYYRAGVTPAPLTAIMPSTTPINPTGDIAAATLEMDLFKFIPKPRVRRLGELHLVAGVRSTVPLTATLVVRAEPNWMKTWAG